jgi:hypothetical protein
MVHTAKRNLFLQAAQGFRWAHKDSDLKASTVENAVNSHITFFRLNLIDRHICSTQSSILWALRRCDTNIIDWEQRGCMYMIKY